jgi:hypothetical protein
VSVTQVFQTGRRELTLRAFGFLQAENVWRLFLEQSLDEADAQADRVDVPGGDLEHVPL